MIPDFNTYLKESHWSEMNRRSQGVTKRKEDDIEHFDRDGFFSYLESHYEYIGTQDPQFYGLMKSSRHQNISVPIYQYIHMPYSIYLEFDGHEGRFLSISPFKGRYIMVPYIEIKGEVPSTLKKLYDNFNVEEVFDMRGFDRIIKYLNITPDEGQPTNRFFLKVIDFMIENIEEPLKKIFVKK
jgi:hypothetical protein